MIREPYIGMPIQMGCNPSNRPVHPAPPQTNPAPPQTNPAPPQINPIPPTPESGHTSGFDALLLGSLPLAMAYVPMQQWNSAYMPAEALIHGTLFPDLNLPFEGGSRP